MQVSDIKQVSAIDHLSFDPPWPRDSYNFEINQSTVSHMVVLEDCPDIPPTVDNASDDNRWWYQFTRWLHPDEPKSQNNNIVGYGGLWKIADESHVSTIATHPDYRGHNYGEILLAGMYGKALDLEANYIVLEVRVSNHIAQNLYRKYSFVQHAVKERYYRSDNEDAYDMRVHFEDAIVTRYHELYQALQDKQAFTDHYTNTPHPRLGKLQN